MTTKRERSLVKRHRSLVIAESDTTSGSSSSEAEPTKLNQIIFQTEVERNLSMPKHRKLLELNEKSNVSDTIELNS